MAVGIATSLGSSDDSGLEWVAPALFVGVTFFQAVSSGFLFRLDRPKIRAALSVYYAVAAFFCLAVTVGAAFRPIIGPLLGGMMSLGLSAIAFTAFYVLTNWSTLAQTRPDAAVFLGSTHVLALVAVAAATARALFPESGEWVAALAQATFLSLTALALPLAAGLWVRLSVHARAKKNTDADMEMAAPFADQQPPQLGRIPTEPQKLAQVAPSAFALPATNNVATTVVIAAALVTATVLASAARRPH